MGHLDWQDDASCREYPTELFFPEDGGREFIQEAKLICSGCPVRVRCLVWTIHQEKHAVSRIFGVYGGLTAHQRVLLIRQAKQSPVILPNGETLLLT